MQNRSPHILIFILALIIANTGFVRADVQLCRTECEAKAAHHASSSPCCGLKKTVAPVMPAAGHGAPVPGDCPHFGSSRQIADPLVFAVAGFKLQAQPHTAILSETPGMTQIPDTRFSMAHIGRGNSPPGIQIPPPAYRLNCSLLI